ncbi:MAG: hypothetical protein JSS72_08290 [Armatimonadetes bacterium]|nr:hypothetical protein [Armatimonadota bacterium]
MLRIATLSIALLPIFAGADIVGKWSGHPTYTAKMVEKMIARTHRKVDGTEKQEWIDAVKKKQLVVVTCEFHADHTFLARFADTDKPYPIFSEGSWAQNGATVTLTVLKQNGRQLKHKTTQVFQLKADQKSMTTQLKDGVGSITLARN